MTGLFMTPTLARSRFLFGWAHDHPASFKETEAPDHILNVFEISTHIQQMLISKFLYFILLLESCCLVVSIANRLRTGQPGARIPVKKTDFSLLQNIQTGSGAHLGSYSLGTGVLSGR